LKGQKPILTERVFIELGSNIDPEHYLPRALNMLQTLGRITAISSAYQNPAIASEPQPDYINAAVLLETHLQPLELRKGLREIEEKLDRVRTADKNAPRTIDLDIALYGDMILDHPLLKVPDEHIYERPHLAITLAECDPEFIHPQTGERLADIAERLDNAENLTRRYDLDLSSDLDHPPRTAKP
jgi:2-amino-4-hydroxy-6-hydroxymethyldihydropteridine diphosphokinase